MTGDFREIIARRRDGKVQTSEEFKHLAEAAAQGTIPDYQLAAWLMAAYLKPLDAEEAKDLTVAMADSGQRLDLSALPRPHLDKHSTGGVGDKTSIVLLPLLAACGLTLVKMSGPGLGVTGGTIDKLSSIPGMRLDLTREEMVDQAKRIGIALTAQTHDLAPADKALYALRDATATTESMALIVSSILSKKIAGGAEVVMLDVKCGSGGFMKTFKDAVKLKALLEDVGARCGLKVVAEITDMNQPLGSSIGNALEVVEAIEVLSGGELSPESQRFRYLCVHLASNTLVVTQIAANRRDAQERVEDALASGEARRKSEAWIAAQGGPSTLDEVLLRLPKAPIQIPVYASHSGYIASLDAGTVGEIVIELGGGRKKKGDLIDLSVGVILNAQISNKVKAGDQIATIHATSEDMGNRAATRLRQAVRISSRRSSRPKLILLD